MKKAVILILASLVLLSFCACTCKNPGAETNDPTSAPNDPENTQDDACVFDPVTDCDNRFCKLGDHAFIELQDSYVFSFDSSPILYWEKGVGEGGVLCSKPECDHQNSDCNAYVGTMGNYSYYNGRIYMLTIPYSYMPEDWATTPFGQGWNDYYSIISMKPDSTDRREEYRIEYENADYPLKMFIHRGSVFLYFSRQVVEHAVPYNTYRVDVIELGKDERRTIYELKHSKSHQQPFFQFRGDEVYIARLRSEKRLAHIELTVYNVLSGAVEETEYEVALRDAWLYDFYLTPDGEMLFAFESDYETYSSKIFAIEDGKAVERIAFEDGEHFFSAGFADGLVCANFMIDPDPDRMLYWITDFDGNLVYKGYLPMEYRKTVEGSHTFGGRYLLVGSGQSFIIMTNEELPFGWVWFLVKYDVSEDGLTETVIGRWDEMVDPKGKA